MKADGWRGAKKWAKLADDIAPTIVGGSKKHGGPDLGPPRSKKAWASLEVNGMTIAHEPPQKDHIGMPRLTVEMVARIQGFLKAVPFLQKTQKIYQLHQARV